MQPMNYALKIALVGLGAVGLPYLQAYTELGFDVVGFDISQDRLDKAHSLQLRAYHIDEFASSEVDIVFVCVGTPQGKNGGIHLAYIQSALTTVGNWLPNRVAQGKYPMVVIRSTMFPGMTEERLIPMLENVSGLRAGRDFGVGNVPETLRETSALADAKSAWFYGIGEYDARTADEMVNFFKQLIPLELQDRLIRRVPLAVAEAAKFIMNTRNASIISFHNMWWLLLSAINVPAQEAIDLSILMGEYPNNPLYGSVVAGPYGGACLPKEVDAMIWFSMMLGVDNSQLVGTRTINTHMEVLAELGRIPAATIDGYRRSRADELRIKVLNQLIQIAGDDPTPPQEAELR